MEKDVFYKAIQKYDRNLLHMEEVLDMLEVFSGDRHYEKLKEICYEQAEKTGEKVEDTRQLIMEKFSLSPKQTVDGILLRHLWLW